MGTADPDRPLHLVPHEPEPKLPARAKDPPRIGLTRVDLLAATAFVDDAEFIESIKNSATALAGDDRQAACVRMIAREVALAKANVDALVAMIGERVRAGHYSGAVYFDKLANSAMRRWAIAVAEHRASCAQERRPIVAIANATGVFIDGGR